jgi:ABC-type lipoprotein export system ATPase subunit
MSEILVETREAGRTYRVGETPLVALDSATCKIISGSHIALVGPSGSGKSTLLHLMGGLDTPTAGTISWPGLGKREALRPEKIAFVFQTQSLLDPLTVVENVEMPLLLGRRSAKDARRAALDVLDRIELADIADKLPEELSGGQTQRVAVARALAYRPRLILADEPTGQLDHPTASHLFDVLLASLEGTDTALVVATHDMGVAGRMHDHWRMQHGVLEVSG